MKGSTSASQGTKRTASGIGYGLGPGLPEAPDSTTVMKVPLESAATSKPPPRKRRTNRRYGCWSTGHSDIAWRSPWRRSRRGTATASRRRHWSYRRRARSARRVESDPGQLGVAWGVVVVHREVSARPRRFRWWTCSALRTTCSRNPCRRGRQRPTRSRAPAARRCHEPGSSGRPRSRPRWMRATTSCRCRSSARCRGTHPPPRRFHPWQRSPA